MKNNQTFQGVVIEVLPIKTLKNGARISVIAIEEQGEDYPQCISLQCYIKDDGADDKLIGINKGDVVKADYNLRANRYVNPNTQEISYFGSNSVWKIETLEQAQAPSGQNQAPIKNTEFKTTEKTDDLPF